MRIPDHGFGALVLMLVMLLNSCGEGESSKAQKDAAKARRDKELLALSYPKSTGASPSTITRTYDSASDRTTMTLRISQLSAARGSPAGTGSLTLHLTSSHKGRVRAADNPEGSIDASLETVTNVQGLLAFAGEPGTITCDGVTTPFRPATGGAGYASESTPAGRIEVARFRIPTEDVVRAANSSSVSISVAQVRIDLPASALADWREFAARLNPRP